MSDPAGPAAPTAGRPEGAENSVDLLEAIDRLTAPFLEEGGPVYVTRCCNFLYAGHRAADLCGTCKKPVVCTVVASAAEAREWMAKHPRP